MLLEFSYETDRFWYNPKNGEIVAIPFNTKIHADYVAKNPEQFGFANRAALKKAAGSLDEYPVNFAAMKNGWIRVFRDRRQPDVDTSIEGTDPRTLKRAVKKVFPFIRLYLGVRTGPDQHDVQSYALDRATGQKFIQSGALPSNESQSTPFWDEELVEIRRRAGIT